MKSLGISMVFLCLIFSSTQVQAETWSAAEKELMKAIEACASAYDKEEDPAAVLSCYRDDFVRFTYGSPDTMDKDDFRKLIPIWWDSADIVERWINPLNIRIVNDVAIIHFYMYTLAKDKDGKESTSRVRRTDVWVKQDGNWVKIADHGGTDPGVKPLGD